LNDLAQRQEQLEGDLSSRSAALRLAVTPVTIANVQRTLPVDTVLVEWIRYLPFNPKASRANRWGTPRYAAFLLKHAGDPTEVDIGPAQPIEQLIAEFRTALSDPTSTYVNVVAGELFKKLVKPLRPVLMQEHRLLLSPDGPLNLVPFAALVDESGDFLVQHFELTYLTSGRDLLRVAVESPAKGAPVILANPNFGKYLSGALPGAESTATRSTDLDRSGLQFAPLAGTAAEAKALQSLLKLDAQNVLTGDRATEASLRDLHGPRILHVATHGFFLNDQEVALMGHGSETGALPFNENPLLRSGLALAGANARHSGTLDDGILTAAEAAQLDLRGTQLVVLSACDTGVGEVRIGEGVYGLRRALVLAGVQAQVGTLWKVADEATKDLMFDFYGRLINGEGRSAALRESQQDMLANPVRKHPYYWAAFVPIGDWTALR
jgi:CHAT domain-containing protein